MNICIAIRTMLMKGNSIYFQASAVIVYNSDARSEFEFFLNKVRAINHTIDVAQNGLL
jgi:anthranilate synthase component I